MIVVRRDYCNKSIISICPASFAKRIGAEALQMRECARGFWGVAKIFGGLGKCLLPLRNSFCILENIFLRVEKCFCGLEKGLLRLEKSLQTLENTFRNGNTSGWRANWRIGRRHWRYTSTQPRIRRRRCKMRAHNTTFSSQHFGIAAAIEKQPRHRFNRRRLRRTRRT